MFFFDHTVLNLSSDCENQWKMRAIVIGIPRVRIAKIHIPPRPSAPINMPPMHLPIAYSAYKQAAVFAEIKNMLIFLYMYAHAPAPRYTKPGPGWWRSLKHTNSTYGCLYRYKWKTITNNFVFSKKISKKVTAMAWLASRIKQESVKTACTLYHV